MERGVKMDLRRSEKEFCLILPESCVEISGIHVEPGQIEYGFSDGHVKLWDHWKIQVMYLAAGEDGAAAEKQLQETVLWEDRFLAAQPEGGKYPPIYQTLPYCVRIAASKGTGSGSRLSLSVVAVTAFGPDRERSPKDLMESALKRLGIA
jgi:hypothetical protein